MPNWHKYLGNFLRSLSKICEALRRLTHKDNIWHWNNEQDKAFQDIKHAFTKAPKLKFFDLNMHIQGQGVASSNGLGFAYYKMADLLHNSVGYSQELNKVTDKL